MSRRGWPGSSRRWRSARPTRFFAPAAAVLVVGGSIGRQVRQTVELILGVTVGLILADGLVHLIGRGPLQLAVVVVLAAGLALLVSGGKMLLNQATTTAVLIVALYPSAGAGIYYERWIDALIGAGVALGVRAVIVPLAPLFTLRRSTAEVRSWLADAFEEGRDGLRAADRVATRDAAERIDSARHLLRELVAEAERVGRLVSVALLHRDTRRLLRRFPVAVPHVGGALGHAHRALRTEADALAAPAPPDLVAAVAALGRAGDELLHALVHPTAGRPGAASAQRAVAWASRPVGVSPTVARHVRASANELLEASRSGS
ncbi:FUSC family protein [Asanoa siamensis]|uniref:Integral membrane bound transporter domain-containing protein n=1 Tax=Asanoa siamensis TaxID=926357 RepID=A0ABQ4CQQ3_9ACTN|nr:FUSC family protein [Asanoa siamensis]GIF73615.1 hypothetical protein Asi02nite_31330 [Asanoa siamensis]